MKENNKKFFNTIGFYERVSRAIKSRGLTLDTLCDMINDKVEYDITRSNLNIYIKRIPNVNFLIALSRSLSVSTDYLLGLNDNEVSERGFDYNYSTQRYIKYNGDYHFYFYPTVNSMPQKLNHAFFSINNNSISGKYIAKLTIITDESDKKIYNGDFILSDSYEVGYITLKAENIGEMVYLSFCDPNINGTVVTIETILGAMLSISAGDSRRAPVMSRFLLSKSEIDEDNYDVIKANLLLNNKYIPILKNDLSETIAKLSIDENLKVRIEQRLISAFGTKDVFFIEESFILNTLSNDFKLNFNETNYLLNNLRINSIANPTNKINKSVDTRIFNTLTSKNN